ncbi:DinB family protein [Allorhodopirellula heiligendammensis]|uniref:DinB superfamily protein n=1 Tax=Allorhodopirellula heiligendammensis TaxID=2714739 RepID=A0A5C6BZW0_9BACT|nr:DinB family protein [Allorhodopirellula heiligendammensis]TWU16911.1 DinB superfamily protein [Allorhodopirellula heiligendammensis]
MNRLLLCPLIILLSSSLLSAADGDPVAVRAWDGGVASIETQWGFNLVVSSDANPSAELAAKADQVVSLVDTVDHVLSRLPNEPKPKWLTTSEFQGNDPNALTVKSIAANALRIKVDGVCVIVATSRLDASGLPGDEDVDVLVLTDAGAEQLTAEPIVSLQQSLRPRVVVPMMTAQTAADGSKVLNHNTLAVSTADQDAGETEIILLSHTPWKMPAELASLFDNMEQACSDSQDVFAQLSVAQLNFQPANGTHTPRWNVEHMMGRQLQFFSQIYHTVDPEVPVMNLNPKQMPADYKFAHPEWDGAEEARQMQRVSEFCRRFAYLLDGVKVDEKAPGSRWPSLRALLIQMDKHYQEHTANTVKKFELPGWPEA